MKLTPPAGPGRTPKALPVIRVQLEKAGVRLAAVLNAALK
jgi:hypothetical protein